jgi:acetyl-CoA carboxylase biotin carboxyl carrier protein
VDLRKIKKLIELLEESALNEIEISEGEESIRLSRTASLRSVEINTTDPSFNKLPEVPTPNREDIHADEQTTIPINSPMVGTFYASPDQESAPYVEAGNEVMVGDTLCIIEAMKIFNHVEAEQTGIVRKILKTSGDPVEYGETLFLIEPSSKETIV